MSSYSDKPFWIGVLLLQLIAAGLWGVALYEVGV